VAMFVEIVKTWKYFQWMAK